MAITMLRSHNEFRSDTFSTPTPSMLEAMLSASLGDDVYQEDETTTAFQKRIAELTGKPAATFCVSGTLSNQIALRTHLFQPPHSVLCDYRSHVYTSEAGGLATLSQAMVTPVRPSNGHHLTLEDVKANILLWEDIHYAPTRVVSLENTLHGTILPLEEIKRISAFCKENNVKLHLDGARIWNASAKTGVSLKEYCSYFDSVSLCLSKGLGAPVGSILVGEEPFIAKAIWFKKQNGGGIRQAGLLCAAANVALDENWENMKEVHAKVANLAEYLQSIGYKFSVPVETNFIFLDLESANISDEFLAEKGKKYGVSVNSNRLVFHYANTDEDIENLKKALTEALAEAPTERQEGGNKTYGTL